MKLLKTIHKKMEWIVFTLLCLFRVLCFLCSEYKITPDSWDYLARDGFAWLQGSLDRYRLPVYPMFLDICQWLMGAHYQIMVCTIQLLVSLFSAIVLYWTIKKLVERKWLCLLVTFLYGTFNAVAGWDKILLTESLSLSLTIFVIFGIVSYIKEKKYRYVWITSACLLIGCFLRAVFAIYAGLFLGFLLLLTIFPEKASGTVSCKKQRLTTLKGVLIALVPVVMVLAYAGGFYGQYGAFTLSDSELGQQLSVVLINGYYERSTDEELKEIANTILTSPAHSTAEGKIDAFLTEFYKSSDFPDTELQKLKDQMLSMADHTLDPSIEATLEGYITDEYQNDYDCSFSAPFYLARLYIMESYDRDRVVAFVDEAKQGRWIPQIFAAVSNSTEEFGSLSQYKTLLLAKILTSSMNVFDFSITLLHTLLIAFVELLVFLVRMLRKKTVDWIRLGLGTYIVATVMLSLLGTNGEFARTAQTCLPFAFVSMALNFNWLMQLVLHRKQTMRRNRISSVTGAM